MEREDVVSSSASADGEDELIDRLMRHAQGLTEHLELVRARVEKSAVTPASVAVLDSRAVREIARAVSTIEMVATVPLGTTPSRKVISQELCKAAGRGVTVTLLLSPHDLSDPTTAAALDRMRSLGVHVRIAMHAPSITVLIVDRGVALVRPLQLDQPGMVLTSPEVCVTLAHLALAYWSRSYVPHDDHWSARGDIRLTAHQRSQILALLVSGDKDEVAARVLGVSLRTYRRYVRHLMDELGASSRFEAGFLAAERGWHTPLSRRNRRQRAASSSVRKDDKAAR